MKLISKKASLLVALMGVMMMVLASCTSVLEGTVVGKDYSESYQESYQSCVMYDTDNPGVCKMYTTNYRTIPEKWTVVIQGVNDKGENDHAVYTVSEWKWNEVYEGDFMRFDERGQLLEHTGKPR